MCAIEIELFRCNRRAYAKHLLSILYKMQRHTVCREGLSDEEHFRDLIGLRVSAKKIGDTVYALMIPVPSRE
jgi:hypothetical protein